MPKAREKPDLDWFTDAANRLRVEANDTFLKSYPLLLRSFSKLKPGGSYEDFNLAVHAAYGWMPAMLDLRPCEKASATDAVRRPVEGEERGAEIDALRTLYNAIGTPPKKRKGKWIKRGKSIVGVSKLLHFLAPDRWAIWDRRVGELWALGGDLPLGYWQYSESLQKLAEQAGEITTKVNQELEAEGYSDEVTTIRALEMLMFYNR